VVPVSCFEFVLRKSDVRFCLTLTLIKLLLLNPLMSGQPRNRPCKDELVVYLSFFLTIYMYIYIIYK
jgi:hypothetical protein